MARCQEAPISCGRRSLAVRWGADLERDQEDYFDIDLDAVIRLTLYSNGQNWEKHLLWVSTLYFERYGRYCRPLVEILYRYNNKHRLDWFRMNPDFPSNDLYKDQRDSLPELRRKLRQGSGPAAPKGLIKLMGLKPPSASPPSRRRPDQRPPPRWSRQAPGLAGDTQPS